MHLILVAFCGLLLSAVLTRAAIPLLNRFGAIADENERTLHTGRIPKGGGLPLLVAALAALLIGGGPVNIWLTTLVAFVAVVSWLNDIQHIPASLRLVLHLMAGVVVAVALPTDALVLQGIVPVWLDRLVTIAGLAWMMNLFNFMDGINGIAGVETISIAAGYLLVAANTSAGLDGAPLAAALAGATGGFLVWNLRPKARIFLGDAGSISLGLVLGCLMIDLAVRGHWAAALILPAYFIADATVTLVQRIAGSENFWEPHASHRYQRAAVRLRSHLHVVALIASCNVALCGLAVLSLTEPWTALVLALGVVIATFAALDRAGRSRFSGTGP